MYTVHDRYVLKRSRISIAFQIFFFILMFTLLFKVLSPFVWILTLPIAGLILYFFQKNDVEVLEYLDEKSWSIQYKENRKIKTRTMRKILSHYFYVVIYFEEKEEQSLVIWKDQVDDQHWRRLLTRAKLN